MYAATGGNKPEMTKSLMNRLLLLC